ncbi:hypothetical protein [Aequorivita antarctica]|uniref:Uncharacterized protein n=1 Tax=Aequorivita antarctica TaxID=153266 RepID=A0A5C6Z017_9FLAO|nr:hypothetical protein [Aequorivita antarctica]TXD72721.1 hypothetical protein ESU54_10895 [Aequorivita antarctica]SRX74755.1 hypothetical protein AEQU3_01735 [Aequorivita antarctica]
MTKNKGILEQPFFWYIFIALVVSGLFFYGIKIDEDRTLLNALKIDLKNSSDELKRYKTLEKQLNGSNDSLELIVSAKEENITELRKDIKILSDSIEYLHSLPPKIKKEYVDRVHYRDNYVEKTNIYGKNKGKISIYNSCSSSGRLNVYINDSYQGSLNRYYPNSVNCPTNSAITKILPVGWHKIYITNGRNTSMSYNVYINENNCQTEKIRCF